MKINDFLHYSNVIPGTSGERTIFGAAEKNLEYQYSDRLVQWDIKKHNDAWKNNKQEPHTSEFYQEYLSRYYDREIELKHIIIGVNVSSGYDYLIFGFTG